MTPFSSKVTLLAVVYQVYRQQPGFREITDLLDVGFPLAFLLDQEIVSDPQERAVGYIDDTWKYFCKWLQIPVDAEYSTLDEMFDLSPIIQMKED